VPAWTTALRVGLIASLLTLAAAAPGAAWRLHANFENGGSKRGAEMRPTDGTCSRMPMPIHLATSLSADDVLFRRRDHQYRKIELQLLERRYAQLKQDERHHSRVGRRPQHLLDAFIQYQRWLAAIDGAANGVALSRLTSNDVNTDPIEEPNGILIGQATFPVMSDGGLIRAANGVQTKDETGALELSGGSIADTDKVTLKADGGLELYFTPNWSFIAKFDGEIRPQPQLYAGSATLDYAW
jgi:hypothetical protein